MPNLDTLYHRHEAQDRDGRDDCDHENMTHTRICGHGTHAVFVWRCPDCGLRETDGYEA